MRLLYLNREEIEKMLKDFEKDTKAIKTELLKICWYMRGGLSYNEALGLSIDEREICSEIIKENLQTTKESGLPFF